MKLILASKSPRRKEILENAGFKIEIKVSNVDETVNETTPINTVMAIAKKKGLDIYNSNKNDIVISADTIVVIDNEILGKPKNKDDARKMINQLQGKSHYVYTAVYIISNKYEDLFYEETKVNVINMSIEEIEQYINTDEPYDKAGGYGIQGIFSKYISSIEGDYYNVMGFPINKVKEYLKKYNIN